ncbi:uncharacterized protein LOC131928828 [Physella acuta]|uniref:uncharacterized protein LOC131928828 n=1 Tax=Physella acuta TaxID=109671 RepID=UPI0027DDD741|nr:uncharacterized protein LOC131928828 [Physella acuta]
MVCGRLNTVVTKMMNAVAKDMAAVCADPEVGSCSDRFSLCSSAEYFLSRVNNITQAAEFCRRVYVGLECFKELRQDPACELDDENILEFERKLGAIIKPSCGTGTTTHTGFLLLIELSCWMLLHSLISSLIG